MQYKNLKDLIFKSSSARKYFLSLPSTLQIKMHSEYNEYIHTLSDLHLKSAQIIKNEKQAEISDSLNSLFRPF